MHRYLSIICPLKFMGEKIRKKMSKQALRWTLMKKLEKHVYSLLPE